jgi:lipoprotein-anchoring transpeptidase ErfK/SrfK
MLRAVCLSSVLLVSLAGAAGPAPAQSFPPPHPIPPVDIGEENISSYASPPTYNPPSQYGRASPAGPGSYHLAGSSGAAAPVYSQPLPPPPQQSTYGASPAGQESYPPAAVDRVPSPGTTPDSQPFPPPAQEPTYDAPSQEGRASTGQPELYPPAPVYRAPPAVYGPADPRPRPTYSVLPSLPGPHDVPRPPSPVGPRAGVSVPGQGGGASSAYSSLPPEVRPELGPNKALPPQFRRAQVDYRTHEPAGTIIIDTLNTYLYLVLGNGTALRYGIGVGREGFTWSGTERISRKAEWPDWNPPAEMIQRQPYLPRFMAGGEGNPLGARALYLGGTLYRIHGTNQPSTIGTFVSSGCIRLTNEDIIDLYGRVQVGTRVVVLSGRAPVTASAAPATPSGTASVAPGAPTALIGRSAPPVPYNPLAPPPGR